MSVDNDTIKLMLNLMNKIVDNKEVPKEVVEPVKKGSKKVVEPIKEVIEPVKKGSKKVVEPSKKVIEPVKRGSKKVAENQIEPKETVEPVKKSSKKVAENQIEPKETVEPVKRGSKKVAENQIENVEEKKSDSEESNKTDDEKKYKKKPIPATLKRLVWNKWIGEEIGKSKCLCCNVTDINQMSFNCGHIIAECKGGETIVSNLKPICQNCNSSMASMNMDEFMKQFL